MPKIIENVREQLLLEAKAQLKQNGYLKTTIRSVAAACGLGVGTVYNYFGSKDALIASFMADQWLELLEKVRQVPTSDGSAVLKSIYHALVEYSSEYGVLFSDSEASKVFATVFPERHKLLRSQLSMVILPLCGDQQSVNASFLAEFIAESMLTWTIEGREFGEQYEIIKKLLK